MGIIFITINNLIQNYYETKLTSKLRQNSQGLSTNIASTMNYLNIMQDLQQYCVYSDCCDGDLPILLSTHARMHARTHARTHTHTHTHTQLFYGSLDSVRDNLGEPVPEETFTHSHLSWSSVIPYLLLPSTMIHDIIPVQFTYLTVFSHNLSPSFLWATSWPGTLNFILHTFLHPIIVFFLQHMPLFHCSTEIMSSYPSLSLYLLLGILSCSFTPHIHLTILISARGSATSFSFLMGHVSFPCNILLAHNCCTMGDFTFWLSPWLRLLD